MAQKGDAARVYRGPVGWALNPLVRVLRGRGLGRRFPALWTIHRLLWRHAGARTISALGHEIELDPLDSMGLASGQYEPLETLWYRDHVRAGQCVVELGANIGYFTLLFAGLVGPSGSVVAYEPDPALCEILRRNLTRNGYHNVTVRQVAAADRSGRATFYRSRDNLGDNRLFSHGDDAAQFEVDCVRLDEDLADLDRRIDLVKVDIQGAEAAAWRGLHDLIRTQPPRRVVMEFWPHGLAGMGDDPRELLDSITAAGYGVHELGKRRRLDTDEVLARLTPQNAQWVNLVCEHGAGNSPSATATAAAGRPD